MATLTLAIVSRQSAEILRERALFLQDETTSIYDDILDRIHEVQPNLKSDDFILYWRYSQDVFLEIKDYLSLRTALLLMVDRTVMLLLSDCCGDCGNYDVESDVFDLADGQESAVSLPTSYMEMITIKSKSLKSEMKYMTHSVMNEHVHVSDQPLGHSVTTMATTIANPDDSWILRKALKHRPQPRYYTADLIQRFNLIDDIKKGYPPKGKRLLIHRDELVIERKVEKKGKDKKDKGKKGKKGGKGDKGKKGGKSGKAKGGKAAKKGKK